jgi:DNA primase
MGIEDEDIARVREASDIVSVISEYTQLKRVGVRWQGLCPFHSEKSPSFSVNQGEGLYYCFGCHASGDVITFVREKERLDFPSAVEKLAARAGITLRYTDKDQGESRRKRQRLVDAMAAAVEWYHQRLLQAPDAAPARKYLRARGLTGDDVRRYRMGWAPDGWDELARALKVPADVFIDAGLGFRNRANRLTDSFRGRILFPIFDVNDNPVAFGGRILPGSSDPAKYKNSAESAIYAKSKTLYALNWAKADIVNANQAIVCEGYTDVIGFFGAGVPRAVATCGTALTEEHVRALKAYATRIVLAFDADAAGQNAAARFYEWERAYDLDVAVAALPPGVDPADLARTDPDALRAAVDGAVPFLRFRLDRVLAAADLNAPEGRAKATEAGLAVIREHPNDYVRDQYVMVLADRVRMDPDRLRAGLARPAPRPSSRGASPARADRAAAGDRQADRAVANEDGSYDDGDPGPGGVWATSRVAPTAASTMRSATRSEGPELEALRLLVLRADEIGSWLIEQLFSDELHLAAYRALRAALDAGHELRAAIDLADPAAAELIKQVMVQETDADPDDVIDLLVDRAAQRILADIERQSRHEDDPEVERALLIQHSEVRAMLVDLRESDARKEAREQLLAWLGQEAERDD